MKKYFELIGAGAAGSIITMIAFLTFLPQFSSPPEVSEQVPVRLVNHVNEPPGGGFNVPFDFTEAAAEASPAVVHIKSTIAPSRNNNSNDPWSQFFGGDDMWGTPFFGFNQPRSGTGSGVIYTPDGYIVTNNHVIADATEIEVTTMDNRVFKAEVVGTYPDGDLAVLKISASNLPTLRLADSDEALVGQWVLAIGNPLELNSTVTAGIISAKGRDLNIIRGQAPIESFIQTDAAVNPGNSGGALVDAQGRLLGINTAIATKTGYYEGYSFAIPINLARKIVDDIIQNGSYERGFLGINIADLDSETAKELNLGINQGVLVDSVVDGGAAQYAGILPNDVIVEANGKQVKATPDLLEVVGGLKAGDTVNLTVNRNGDLKTILVRLKAAN
ncbi:MAG: Do family serine endopeptidase [Saprospiraceae bacterium]